MVTKLVVDWEIAVNKLGHNDLDVTCGLLELRDGVRDLE